MRGRGSRGEAVDDLRQRRVVRVRHVPLAALVRHDARDRRVCRGGQEGRQRLAPRVVEDRRALRLSSCLWQSFDGLWSADSHSRSLISFTY